MGDPFIANLATILFFTLTKKDSQGMDNEEKQLYWEKVESLLRSKASSEENVQLAYNFVSSLAMKGVALKSSLVWQQMKQKQLLPIIIDAAPQLFTGRQWRKIDLSTLGLTQADEVPKGLLKIPQLKELNLSNNNLSELPEWFSELTQVYHDP